jgi:hypothetical protein
LVVLKVTERRIGAHGKQGEVIEWDRNIDDSEEP